MKKIIIFIVIVCALLIIMYFAFAKNSSTVSDSGNLHQNIMSDIGQVNFISSNVTTKGQAYFEDEISSFSTNVFGDTNRLENIKLSCNAINGTILQNGETFSFNDIVGNPTEEKGYKEADVIIGTKTEKGLGGGNCQVSTTLYNACLNIPEVEIIERNPHKKKVAYVDEGKDASVSFGVLDLKFKNNTGFPIKIFIELTDSTVDAKIFK